jgi:hypothetical protein
VSTPSLAFAAIDIGTATVAVSLVGRLTGRWHVLGSASAPVTVGPDALIDRLVAGVIRHDPELARALDLEASARELPRVVSQTGAPPVLAVIAASERALAPLRAAATEAGWRVRALALGSADLVAVTRLLADGSVDAVLAGAGEPPGSDERSLLPELGIIVAAAAERRPDLVVILAGGLADPGGRYEALLAPQRPGETILAPAATAGSPPGETLRALLFALAGPAHDGRRAVARACGTLSTVLERRVELVEVGASAGTRITAEPLPGMERATIRSAVVTDAALVPASGEAVVDAVARWLTVPLDRLRLGDRLQELVIDPWAEPAGDGALLRLAMARSALERLVQATPSFSGTPVPDLLVATGGVWSVAPGPAIALALIDALRRPGATGLGFDHARLLGPLGMIEDEAERRTLIADLRDELLTPLGSVVMPAGVRAGPSAGKLTVHAGKDRTELELVPGGLELVDLPPGDRAIVELRFRHTVDLGSRGRHFAVEVGGGLGGLLVDLRDVPLRLPDRPERRRDLLAAWQAALWTGMDS